ncbi:MAG: paraquat-inducible membrane protein A [Deltaproteobacteria bacterium]|nr:paraquat-inducible membrane protein A [Deltaproteobacteria bacterium]
MDQEVWVCLECSQSSRITDAAMTGRMRINCPRCGASLSRRKPDTLARTWALLIAAAVLYIPANLYPFLHIGLLAKQEASTILAGIQQLFQTGMWGVAIIIFFASILVPLLKILGLAFLLASVQLGSQKNPVLRTRMYRIIEGIGRWSMIDVFVVSLMIGLISFGQIATIEPGVGATCFGAVVVLTLLAASSFDARFIWDGLEKNDVR